MNDDIPDEEHIRCYYAEGMGVLLGTETADAFAEFDRWLVAYRRAVAWEAIQAVHDHFGGSDQCEPVESALERHFGFTEPAGLYPNGPARNAEDMKKIGPDGLFLFSAPESIQK